MQRGRVRWFIGGGWLLGLKKTLAIIWSLVTQESRVRLNTLRPRTH